MLDPRSLLFSSEEIESFLDENENQNFSSLLGLETLQYDHFSLISRQLCIVFSNFSAFKLLLVIFPHIKPCHISRIKRDLYFCVTISDSVYNKQITTRQDPDIVYIHLFWYHTSHSFNDSLGCAMILKLVIKTISRLCHVIISLYIIKGG